MPFAKKLLIRTEDRENYFHGEFSCTLIPIDSPDVEIPIRPLDVSARGMGFLASKELQNGGYFYLKIGETLSQLRVELAYCSNYLGIDNLFRCGLFLREEFGDLKLQCAKAGILETEEAQI